MNLCGIYQLFLIVLIFLKKKNVKLVPNETAHREDIEETDKCRGPILKNENKKGILSSFLKKLVMTAHTHDAQTLRKCAHTFLLDQFAPGNPSLLGLSSGHHQHRSE